MSDKKVSEAPQPAGNGNGGQSDLLSRGVAAMDMVHEHSSPSSSGDGPPMIVDLLNMHPASGETNGAKTTNGGASRETTTAAAGEDITDARKIQGGEGGSGNGNGDQSDAWPQGWRRGGGRGASPTPPPAPPGAAVADMPVAKDSEVYNMNHRRRGVAFIFNHMHFDEKLQLKQRNGTNCDRDNLRLTLRSLDFEVRVYNDLCFKDIERLLEDCAMTEDHSDADCVLVAVLSHGEMGILYARDNVYKPDRLWSHFNAENCPTLAGKPKMFFIQACQGDRLDSGVHLRKAAPVTATDSANGSLSYKIPSHADFLIAYSTIPGFYSWRNTTAGSWFVQALCHVLQREAGQRDLMSMLTRVCRKVAFDFQSNTPGDYGMHEKKQIPCITSMLTRDVFFYRKHMTT